MKLNFEPFDAFIRNYTTGRTRARYADSEVKQIDLDDGQVSARVRGTSAYHVSINYNSEKVLNAHCNCLYDQGGYCKHIVHVLVHADRILADRLMSTPKLTGNQETADTPLASSVLRKDDTYTLEGQTVLGLSRTAIERMAMPLPRPKSYIVPLSLEEGFLHPNRFSGTVMDRSLYRHYKIDIQQLEDHAALTCNCNNRQNKLCGHLHFVLLEILKQPNLQLAFDTKERHYVFGLEAERNGWQSPGDPDDYFSLSIASGRLYLQTKVTFLPYSEGARARMKQTLLPQFSLGGEKTSTKKEFIAVQTGNYSHKLSFLLLEAPLTKGGEIKAPIGEVSIPGKLRTAQTREEALFYAGFLALKANYHPRPEDYRDVLHNPQGLDIYWLNGSMTGKITPNKLTPLSHRSAAPEVEIRVEQKDGFYRMTCEIITDQGRSPSKKTSLFGDFFIQKDTLYCLNNEAERKVLSFFEEHKHEIYLQSGQFASFKTDFLDQLENNVKVSYDFIKPAPKRLKREQSLDVVGKPVVYLSESDNFVLITPAVSYGDVEVPLLSKKTVYASMPDGTLFTVTRNEEVEHRFVRIIQHVHSSFDTLPQTEYYYLHKKEFLDEGWFVDAFEQWRQGGFRIMGFSQLKNNRYNENPIKIRASVQSGIDWFDIHTEIACGEQKVSLKQIQKSVANKTRYVELGDGTQGILPQEWINKFSNYFRAGEVRDNVIRTHKSNFQLIDELFEEEVLSREVQLEIRQYKEKLAGFHSISSVKVPKKLKAKLRDYQKEGLNWLNFLDEFGFGGCLADDMGLGKTVQVIAYFLVQHEKGNKDPNLVVVPTSLLFNWQKELDKFAPHLRYTVLYGTKRKAEKINLKGQHIVLTTYGTLLSDIRHLKELAFNVIVLDESQAIKNPDSKRYKAVRLLNGRQRLVLTGTPVENNTFDLYAQLSFALPGLLGSAKRFAEDYSTPIDRFQDAERASELQKKIHPFVLRRTKTQVATELPEKTEMVVHCEMGKEQKRVYESYKYEFQKYLNNMDEEELHSSSLHVLQGLTKLRQICNSPALLADEEFYGNQSAKLEVLMEQIDTLKDTHKILVFSQFVGMLDLIRVRLDQSGIGYAYLTGKTKKREEQVRLFQENEQTRVFLISLRAGGTGLNLTRAEYVFLVDPWWNPAVENQAIDRAYRIGQQNKVVAVRFITPDSIEEKITELQGRKRQLAEDLIHTDGNMFKQLSKEDLLGLL